MNLGLEKGGYTTLDQTVVVDADTTKLYILAIGCSDTCYEKNKDEIDEPRRLLDREGALT